MKNIVKSLVPKFFWETLRSTYVYLRRLALDIKIGFNFRRPLFSTRFIFVLRKAESYTMVKIKRLKKLYELSEEIKKEKIDGDIVECGVYNGGTAAIAAYHHRKNPKKHVWLFDSFEGLPPPSENDSKKAIDMYYKGWCKGDTAKVSEVFDKISFPKGQLHIIEGWFSDTFPKANIQKISLLHIDADLYDSVKLCLEKFYENVASGGYIVFDDYGSTKWGCKKAVDEFFKEKGVTIELKQADIMGHYFKKK